MATISLEEIGENENPIDTFPFNDFPSYKAILSMIESLPEGYGKVFKLAVLEGLSHKEISLLLNIAPHSSSSQLSRAKICCASSSHNTALYLDYLYYHYHLHTNMAIYI